MDDNIDLHLSRSLCARKGYNRIEFGNGLCLCEHNLVRVDCTKRLHDSLCEFISNKERRTDACFFSRKNAYRSLFWKETVESELCNRTVAEFIQRILKKFTILKSHGKRRVAIVIFGISIGFVLQQNLD